MPQFIPGRLKVRSSQLNIGSNIDLIPLLSDTWENLGQFDIQLPTAGTYLITTQFTSAIRINVVTDTLWILSRVVRREGSVSVEIPQGYRMAHYLEFPVINELYYTSNNGTFIYEATGADLLSVDVSKHGSNITTMQLQANDAFGFGGSFISYYQIGL